MISYTINKLEPLEVEETVKGEGMFSHGDIGNPLTGIFLAGGLCGSVYLNIGFQKYIETLIGKDQYDSLSDPSKRKMMTEFDQTLKRIFNERSNEVHTIDLYGVEDDPENGIDDNTTVLKKHVIYLQHREPD